MERLIVMEQLQLHQKRKNPCDNMPQISHCIILFILLCTSSEGSPQSFYVTTWSETFTMNFEVLLFH
jgi:hypothetical protein